MFHDLLQGLVYFINNQPSCAVHPEKALTNSSNSEQGDFILGSPFASVLDFLMESNNLRGLSVKVTV